MKHIDISDVITYGLAVFVTLAVILAFAVLIIDGIANGNNRIDAGVIVDRFFDSGYSGARADKYGGHYYSYHDTYYFVIEGKKDGETVRYRFEVTAEEYEKYRIGDYYER